MTNLRPPFSERLTFLLELISSGCLTLMAVLVVAQVVLRYVFNQPLTWSEELARITFIYLTFMGIGAAYGRRRHMFVDSFVGHLPPRIRKALQFSVVVVASVFLLAILIVTTRSMVELFRMELSTPVLELSMAFVYLTIPLGLSAFVAEMWIHLHQEREG